MSYKIENRDLNTTVLRPRLDPKDVERGWAAVSIDPFMLFANALNNHDPKVMEDVIAYLEYSHETMQSHLDEGPEALNMDAREYSERIRRQVNVQEVIRLLKHSIGEFG